MLSGLKWNYIGNNRINEHLSTYTELQMETTCIQDFSILAIELFDCVVLHFQ